MKVTRDEPVDDVMEISNYEVELNTDISWWDIGNEQFSALLIVLYHYEFEEIHIKLEHNLDPAYPLHHITTSPNNGMSSLCAQRVTTMDFP